jgi:hypothetical protein
LLGDIRTVRERDNQWNVYRLAFDSAEHRQMFLDGQLTGDRIDSRVETVDYPVNRPIGQGFGSHLRRFNTGIPTV